MPHPEHGETQEFDRLGPEGVRERTELELIGHYRVPVRFDFAHPIELRLGYGETRPLIFYRGSQFSTKPFEQLYHVLQLDASGRPRGAGASMQSCEKYLGVGREASPQFDLGPDVSRRHLLITTEYLGEEDVIEIETFGRNGTRVVIHPDDLAGEAVAVGDQWPAALS